MLAVPGLVGQRRVKSSCHDIGTGIDRRPAVTCHPDYPTFIIIAFKSVQSLPVVRGDPVVEKSIGRFACRRHNTRKILSSDPVACVVVEACAVAGARMTGDGEKDFR